MAAGYTYREWFSPNEHIIPIRHVEGDYKAPFIPGQTYDVTVTVESLGTTSFKMKYLFEQNGRLHATVRMVHSVLNPKTKDKMPLPEIMKQRLTPYLEATHGN